MGVSTQPVPAVSDGSRTGEWRTGIATVCLSGTLEDKLAAAAEAGFDGVELFEPDLIASPWTATDLRERCAVLGLSIDLYQPFRDFDSVSPATLSANLRRAEHKFDVMAELGTDLMLVCSSVAPDAVDDTGLLAGQLHELAVRAGERGLRVCYEALAWGRHVNTYQRSWDVVRRADHAALGLCLDSFHILSRGSDPAGIRDIPGEKLFFLQLADAPYMLMDVLQWSRHHRLFPGEGAFDLPAFMEHVLAAGYRGPVSLEIFNDVFRQSSPRSTAVDALRSLLALREDTSVRLGRTEPGALPPAQRLGGNAFTELSVDDAAAPWVQSALTALGFIPAGHHRTERIELWSQGEALMLLRATDRAGAAVSALGVHTGDPAASARRAEALLAPVVYTDLGRAAAVAPDDTAVCFCPGGPPGDWLAAFDLDPGPAPRGRLTHTDHVALTQPFDRFDEATLFYRSLLGLGVERTGEVAAPFGVVRNRAMTDPDRTVRICLSVSALRRGDWRPGVADPQHVAFATSDVLATARAAREAGAPILSIPDNYYDDLDARLAMPAELLAAMRETGMLYDRGEHGEFLHCYTEVLGSRIFFELVQRIDGYDGYGEVNAPVRMATHARARRRTR